MVFRVFRCWIEDLRLLFGASVWQLRIALVILTTASLEMLLSPSKLEEAGFLTCWIYFSLNRFSLEIRCSTAAKLSLIDLTNLSDTKNHCFNSFASIELVDGNLRWKVCINTANSAEHFVFRARPNYLAGSWRMRNFTTLFVVWSALPGTC